METNTKLFKLPDGNWFSNQDLSNLLRGLGAHDCDVLFVHTALNFGAPNPELRPKELLGELLDVLRRLNVPTLCMPTFTFSFCNGKSYDPMTSKSRMGVLNEFFRKQEGVIRSNDPLMSVALEGEHKHLVNETGHHSIGENSTYDKLHHTDGVKFLFLGPRIGDCFTYMHYLEWLFEVDYRYSRTFRGVIENQGTKCVEEYDLFVRYNGVLPNDNSFAYEDRMVEDGVAARTRLGGGFLSVVSEDTGTKYYRECLLRDPHYFVNVEAPIKDRTFVLNKEMVAL